LVERAFGKKSVTWQVYKSNIQLPAGDSRSNFPSPSKDEANIMGKYKAKLNGSEAQEESKLGAEMDGDESEHDDGPSKLLTVGVVVVGAALIETAWIPGILLGAAAAIAPKYLPRLGERVQPLFNSTVRGAYKLGRKARSAVGEVREQMSDIAAEVDAEDVAAASEPTTEPAKA
jgi:hypothetical protein